MDIKKIILSGIFGLFLSFIDLAIMIGFSLGFTRGQQGNSSLTILLLSAAFVINYFLILMLYRDDKWKWIYPLFGNLAIIYLLIGYLVKN